MLLNMYDVVIIGAGVIGGSILRELMKYKLKVLVLEKENDVSMGTSKANSGIVHAGYDPNPESVVAKYNVLGNKMYEELCNQLDVPFKRNGALVIGFNDEDIKTIEKLYNNGCKMGVKDLRILKKHEILEMEPNISKDVTCALYAPTSGIVSPYEYTIALFENSIQNGAHLKLNKEVVSISKDDCFEIKTHDGDVIKSKYLVNAAGVHADEVHNMICEKKFKITPRSGQYIILDKKQGSLVNHTIFQCPSKLGKGILVTPTAHSNLLVGPDALDTNDKDRTNTTLDGLNDVKKVASITTDKINYRYSIRNFSGLRAISSNDDFIIEENSKVKGFVDVAGMKSPGLTSAPAISLGVLDILKESGLKLEKNDNFNPYRKQIRFIDLSDSEKDELIKKDPSYGRVICRCENITEGEIIDAIHRSFGVPSVDGIKRRCRPGMGRCQGGFCGPHVQRIIARECNVPIENIVLDRADSFILYGKIK